MAAKGARQVFAELVRFGVIGVLATLVHAVSAIVVHEVAGLPRQGANLCGYILAVWVSLFGHARFTFGLPRVERHHVLRFVAVSLVALVVSAGITALGSARGWSFAGSMLGVALVVPGATYLASKLWAFSLRQSH